MNACMVCRLYGTNRPRPEELACPVATGLATCLPGAPSNLSAVRTNTVAANAGMLDAVVVPVLCPQSGTGSAG